MIDKTDPTNRDTVPAMLTPGEFVLNKEASTMFAPVIEQMNSAGLQHRAMKNMGGGIPTYNTGGLVPFLKEVEGYGQPPNHDKSYQDQAGVWTIGYGRTRNADGSLIKPNQTSDKKSEESWLKVRAQKDRDATVEYGKKHGYDWNDNQIDALASFRFNIGNLDQLTDFGKRDMATITAKIPEYNQAGGKVSDGLINRRQAELNLFSGGSEPSQETPQPTTQTASAEPVPRFFSGGGADGEGSFGKVGDFFSGVTTPSVAPMASVPPQMRPKDLAPQMAAGSIDTMASSRPQMRPNTQADPVAVEQAIMQASVPQVQAAPPEPTDFGEAFKDARADMGAGGIFNFRGRDYNTNYAEEKDMVTANMGGSIYLNTGGLSIDQMARRKLQEDVDNAWFKRNERDALTKFDQANLALQAMPQSFAAPSPMQTEGDQLPRVLPGSGPQQEPSMADQGGPNRVPPMSPPMPDVNSDESLLQGSSGNVDQAFKFKQLQYSVPKPGQGLGLETFGPGNIFNNGQTIPEIRDPRELGGTEGYGQTGDATSRRAAAQQRLIALRENLVTGSPEHIKVSNLITGAFTPSMTSLDELVDYNIPASIMDSDRMMVGNVPMGDGVPNMVEDIIKSRIPNPAANLDVGHPDRVAAIEAGTLEPTDADYAFDEEQYRLSEALRQNRIDQAVAIESSKTDRQGTEDGSLKDEEQRLANEIAAMTGRVPPLNSPPVQQTDIAMPISADTMAAAALASGIPSAKTNPEVILQVANQRQTAEDAIEQAKRDLATAEAGIRNAATAEQVLKYEEMGRQAKTNLTTSSADLVEAQEQQIQIDEVDAAAEADKSTLIRTSQAQADAAREAALSSLGFSKIPEKKGPGSTKGPMIKTGPNGTILDANGKAIVNLTPQEAITSDVAAKAKAKADIIAAEGGGKKTPEVSGAMSMLKGVFGDLFDSKELIRAAVMYLGGRATGMSGNQALAFAGKNYIARTDAKEGAYQKVALEGKHTKSSLAIFKKSMDFGDLVTKGLPAVPTGDFKTMYDRKTGREITLTEKKVGDGSYWFDGNEQVDVRALTNDGRFAPKTAANVAYKNTIRGNVESLVTSLDSLNPSKIPDAKAGISELGIAKETIGREAVTFAIENGMELEQMEELVEKAYKEALVDARSGKKPTRLSDYFSRAWVESNTTDAQNFFLPGETKDGKPIPVPVANVTTFLQTIKNAAAASGKEGLANMSDTQVSSWLMSTDSYKAWQTMDPDLKKEYIKNGAASGRSGMMEYIISGMVS